MRAGIYVRISRDMAGEGLGVQRQTEDCREHAQALGWEIADTYVDNDVSATGRKPRPHYQRMLTDLRTGDITAIVAWHPDRLYRKVTDLAELVEVCKDTNAQISTVKSGEVDLSTPTGRLLAGMLAQIATYEVEHKSERWSRSWRQGRESGHPITSGPNRLFGYMRDGVTVIDSEATVARRMASDLATGGNVTSIVRWLSDEAITTTAGNTWTRQAVKNYLKNPRIAGFSTLGGEIVGPGDWPPILEPATWEEVRAILDSRTSVAKPRRALLLGLLYCGRPGCGARMVSSGAGRKVGGGSRRVYRCEAPGCGLLGVAEPIEEIVEEYAQARLDDPTVRARIESLRAQPTGAQNELAALELRIKELEHQLDEPGTPIATILRAIDRAKDRQAELLDKLAAQPRVDLPGPGIPWPDDLLRRRSLVDLVVQRVELAPSEKASNRFQPERVSITPR